MRVSSVLSEVARNILSGTTRAVLFAVLLGVGTGAFAAADALTIVNIQTAAHRYVESGAAVRTLTTSGEVDPVTCERLSETTGILQAGALREAAPTELPALPRSPLSTFESSPTFGELLGIDQAASGAWVSQTLADSLGVHVGDRLETSLGTTTIAATFDYPSDGRDARLGLSIIIPTVSTGSFDECWALVWPENPDLDTIIRSATTPGAGQADPITIAQLNKTHGSAFDGLTTFRDRITQWATLASGLLGVALGWFSVTRRRLEHASSLHAGQTRPALLASVLVETTVWVLASAIIGAELLAAALVVSTGSVDSSLFWDLTRTVFAGSYGAVLGAVGASLLIREKHLFRFFKERG